MARVVPYSRHHFVIKKWFWIFSKFLLIEKDEWTGDFDVVSQQCMFEYEEHANERLANYRASKKKRVKK